MLYVSHDCTYFERYLAFCLCFAIFIEVIGLSVCCDISLVRVRVNIFFVGDIQVILASNLIKIVVCLDRLRSLSFIR